MSSKRKNGQGSIALVESANGKIKYRMRQQYGYLRNGRPRILTVTATSETDAIKKMRRKIENAKSQYLTPNSDELKKKTLTDLCMLHLNYHLNQRGRLKPKAADRRESTIRNQIAPYTIGKLQATSVKSQDVNNHIENLINEGKLSVSSITKTLDVINSAYKWANDQAYFVEFNPCRPVMDMLKTRLRNLEKRNSSSGVVRVLSDEQISVLEGYVNQMDKKLSYHYILGLSALLLLYTGMRQGEMCALRWEDYDDLSHTLSINKTRNIAQNRTSGKYIPNENEVKNYHSRDIVLSDAAVRIIEEIQRVSIQTEQEDYIIYNRVNKPTNPSNYGVNLNKLYLAAGLSNEISGAHILRRTCATKMHNEGCRVEDIAAYLGDTPETIIKHYISLTKKIVADGRVLNVVQLPTSKKSR